MLEKIQEVFEDVFDCEPEQVTLETTIDNLDEWDSLKHLQLVTTLEEEFNHKFSMDEIINLNSVAKIIESLQKNKSSAA